MSTTSKSSWKSSQFTTPSTTVTATPVDSELKSELISQISNRIEDQTPGFILEDYPDFVTFVKKYYKSQELKGYSFDIIQNIDQYYNINLLDDLVVETELISTVSVAATEIDVNTTLDFPNEGLLLIDDEIIYYQSKNQTQFLQCSRGFDAVEKVGLLKDFIFSETEASIHSLGTTVVNLNNILPLFLLARFKDQFLANYPKNLFDGVKESTVIKRIKDFYSAKGTARSFQFLMRSVYGVESEVTYPRDRIFKPSDAFFDTREVIRASAVIGNPEELVGGLLYQESDPTDSNVQTASIYVKNVTEVFTEAGQIYEIDVDTNNSSGTFITPYKTILAEDIPDNLNVPVITVDSTIGWPELNGRIRIEDEVIEYAEKTVNQFLGCVRDVTQVKEHISGNDVTSAFEYYGYSNVDDSKITIKIFGGTRGIQLETGGKYYLPESNISPPNSPGFDSADPIWTSFIYNIKKLIQGVGITFGLPDTQGRVIATIVCETEHGFKRNDEIVILNAPEDVYNDTFIVIGVSDAFSFDVLIPQTPIAPVTDKFLLSRNYLFGKGSNTTITNSISKSTTDVQNTYKSAQHAIIASTGIPGHQIGPFKSGDPIPGNQRYLKRIPLLPITKSVKDVTPSSQIGIGVNGVPFFSYKSPDTTIFGGVTEIQKISEGDGYDVTNPPLVEFEPTWQRNTRYAANQRITYGGNRYLVVNAGRTGEFSSPPSHVSGDVVDGTVTLRYEGQSAEALVSVVGKVIAINVLNGGTGYTSEPIVSIVGGGAPSSSQATANAIITNGTVTSIEVLSTGAGYTSLPSVSISGGGGTGATALAVVRGGIEEVHITNPGTAYTYNPELSLIAGNGAVAYPSILNGQIQSIIVTFGGEKYYGPPDVVIIGDGVGATAFANIDPIKQIVTSVTVTNKGIGYTAGKTSIFIVYPGSGAEFKAHLTSLTYNQSASNEELGLPAAAFTPRKQIDPYNGSSYNGPNESLYGGEYGYPFNPRQLRYLLEDNISSSLQELTPTRHSPIIGWAYDGHPIYGPYGYIDPENKNPFNQLKLIKSSYRVKSSRLAILTGLQDPLGTFIEDYEFVEGLGDLDKHNGRFCITPEYPQGVYAYFCTIDGTTGKPKFPYFVGPTFYSQADPINWNGNGLQRGFTEEAIRYKAPHVLVDTLTVKRKTLGPKEDILLALEDTTTAIVLENGDYILLEEDGIGYYSFFPFVKGGKITNTFVQSVLKGSTSNTGSLFVSATNRYFSKNIDSYLIEGGGFGYKVNDKLIFDEEDTGGTGISGFVSRVEGVDAVSLNYTPDVTDDTPIVTLTTSENHYVIAGDTIDVDVEDNAYLRTIKTYIISNKYYFDYFNISAMSKASTGGAYSGTITTPGSGYANGTWTNVPLTGGTGTGAKATIVVSGGAVTSVTITTRGTGYGYNNTLSANQLNLGNVGGSGFVYTLTNHFVDVTVTADAAHQLRVGDTVNIAGVNPSAYDKSDYIVTEIVSPRKFKVQRNFGNVGSAAVGLATIKVKEPLLNLITGHSYKFDTTDGSNDGKELQFSLDSQNTNIFTYKNITDYEFDPNTGKQNYITIYVNDLPGTIYYFDILGSVTGKYFQQINDPYKGSQTVISATNTTITYKVTLEPENSYTASAKIKYSTNSIYASGGIARISLGDPGNNYLSLPRFVGTSRSGSGAIAEATISGFLDDVAIVERGEGYNSASLPTAVVTMPDFVDLTLDQVIGTFIENEVITSQESVGTQTARGRVISWNPATSVLRVQPIQNLTSGAANKGYIMFSISNANRNKVYSSASFANITNVSGQQAVVGVVIPSSGPFVGKVESVSIVAAGSNYRNPPTIVLDNPYYGRVKTVSITSQNTSANFTSGIYDNVTQKSVAPTGGTGVKFTVVIDATSKDVTSVAVKDLDYVTNGGSTYALGDVIRISGAQITGGVDGTDDFYVTVTSLDYVKPAQTSTRISASIDGIKLLNGGSGYNSSPEIVVAGGQGTGASLRAQIVNQSVSNIIIESPGQAYQSPPSVVVKQGTGVGASIILKSSNVGEIIALGGDNITYNYSHDRTLKPSINTNYNLQLTRTQIIEFVDLINGGSSFVTTPTIVLEGGGGSGAAFDIVVENEVVQSITVTNPGKGFSSTPELKVRLSHNAIFLTSNNTVNFLYDTKLKTGTKVTFREISGSLPQPLVAGVTYYVIQATIANGLGSNQIRLATSLANAISESNISFTSKPLAGANGNSNFILDTTDLGVVANVFMKPAEYAVGERVFQGVSSTIFSASGIVRSWDSRGRVLSVEADRGEFKIGEPVFGLQTGAFGEIHDFERAEANFIVSPISTSNPGWRRTTGILDLNQQRLYDSDRFQEFSYDIKSPINLREFKNSIKYSAHPAGFKLVGTQVITSVAVKDYRVRPTYIPTSTSEFNWWQPGVPLPELVTFNGTTSFIPKPTAVNIGKLSKIDNFALAKPDYSSIVPTEVLIEGRQLLDIRKILTNIVYKVDPINLRTLAFDASSASVVNLTNNTITIQNHGLVQNQRVTYNSGGDRFQDARNLILANIEYIKEESIGYIEALYPTLTDGSTPDYDPTICKRDIGYIVIGWCNDLRYGGNSYTLNSISSYYSGSVLNHIDGELTETISAFNKARDLCILAINNNLPAGTYTNITPFEDTTITVDPGGCANVVSAINTLASILTNGLSNPSSIPARNSGEYPNLRAGTSIGGLQSYFGRNADAANLIIANAQLIAEVAVSRTLIQYPGFSVPGGNQNCIDDIKLILDVVLYNLKFGGNDLTYDAAKVYVDNLYLQGEETQSAYAYGQVRDMCIQAMRNETITITGSSLTQFKDLSIIVDTETPTCANVASSLTTLFGIVIQAIGTTGSPGNLTGINRTSPIGDRSFYVNYIDANTISLSNTPNGSAIDLTSLGNTTDHQLTLKFDGINTKFKLRLSEQDIVSPQKSQFLISLNGIVQNPTTYTLSGNTLTFSEAPKEDSTILIMYYTRTGNYSTNFILDTIGDSILTFNTTDGIIRGAGYTNGTYTNVPLINKRGTGTGATANIVISGGKISTIAINQGGSGYTNNDIVSALSSNLGGGTPTQQFQVEVSNVTFDGVDTSFVAQVGGSPYALPANDNFLIFLNSHIQKLGSNESYTYTGINIDFNEAPKPNMDFYGFYVGQLLLIDDISPFFNNTKKTFTLKVNNVPFSLESDDPNVRTANNLVIFINGVLQEPDVSYTLNGAILEFDEAPRTDSECIVYLYTGSSLDILIQETFSSVDVNDQLQIVSEGSVRTVASISSSKSIDTYEYKGLRPSEASFQALVSGGRVTSVNIVDPGLNYETPPYLLFSGGGGTGAFAETIIEQGSGKVVGIKNLNPGYGYSSSPDVQPYHPVSLIKTQKNRTIGNSLMLGTTYLTTSINDTDTSIQTANIWYINAESNGFQATGEIVIPYWNSSISKWLCERILYSAANTGTNIFTVATGGRGYKGSGASSGVGYGHDVISATYSSSISGSNSLVAITTPGAHNLSTGQKIYYMSFTNSKLNGSHSVTVTSSSTFTVTVEGVPVTGSGSVSLYPVIRLVSI
jgi:hypothetical protein